MQLITLYQPAQRLNHLTTSSRGALATKRSRQVTRFRPPATPGWPRRQAAPHVARRGGSDDEVSQRQRRLDCTQSHEIQRRSISCQLLYSLRMLGRLLAASGLAPAYTRILPSDQKRNICNRPATRTPSMIVAGRTRSDQPCQRPTELLRNAQVEHPQHRHRLGRRGHSDTVRYAAHERPAVGRRPSLVDIRPRITANPRNKGQSD